VIKKKSTQAITQRVCIISVPCCIGICVNKKFSVILERECKNGEGSGI